jgi:hypothetical protein
MDGVEHCVPIINQQQAFQQVRESDTSVFASAA